MRTAHLALAAFLVAPTAFAQPAPVAPAAAAPGPAAPAPAQPAAAPPAAAAPAPAPATPAAEPSAPAAEPSAPAAEAAPAAEPVAPEPIPAPSPVAAPPVAPQPAPAPLAPDEPDWSLTPLGSHQDHWLLMGHVRAALIRDAGYDLFSEDDSFVQGGFAFGRTLFTSGRLSFAALALWDYGTHMDSVRGQDTELGAHRFTLGAEGRYHFLHQFYVYGRVAPGALLEIVTLESAVSGAVQSKDAWAFALDGSVGTAYELFGEPNGAKRSVRGWVFVEGGYGFGSSTELALTPKEPDNAPARSHGESLGDLALGGLMLRGGLMLSL